MSLVIDNSRKKTEDGVISASSEYGSPNESCWMCGVKHTQEQSDGIDTPQRFVDTTVHEPWCEMITRKIYEDFQGTFREIYSVLELALDGDKLKTAKSLIGNKIMESRNQAIQRVIDFNKN
jgi:hypothetical protein